MRTSNKTIQIMCAGAVKGAVEPLLENFCSTNDLKLKSTFGTVGGLTRQIEGGSPAHVIVLSIEALRGLASRGLIDAESIMQIGVVRFAIAQRVGTPSLDVSSREALRACLLECESFAYADPSAGDTSGKHMSSVIDRLGLQSEIASKTVFAPLGLAVAAAIADGLAEIGAAQTSIILARSDLQIAGPLPDEFQLETTYGVALGSGATPGAIALQNFLQAPDARAHFLRAGFERADG